MVKDEADVLGVVLDHLADQGVNHVLVVDNGSTDGTLELLRGREADGGLIVGHDLEPAYYQAQKMTALARFAWRSGADWVVPFDADELWFARGGSLAARLRAEASAVLEARIHNVFPSTSGGDVIDIASPVHGKVAFRAHPLARLSMGNHAVDRPGERSRSGDLVIVHRPWRSLEQFARKVRQGAAALAHTGLQPHLGGHWRTLGAMDDDELTDQWQALLAGQHDETLHWTPVGPLVPVDLSTWSTWDPREELEQPGRP